MREGLLRAKFKASSVSLAVWALSATVLFLCTWYLWYPKFLFWHDGGLNVLRLMMLIDFALGPVLMFVAFNPNKARRLVVLDFAVIISLQLAGLVYGIYQIHQQRPVLLSYYNGEFHPVRATSIEQQGVSPAEVVAKVQGSPKMMIALMPTHDQLQQALALAMLKGVSIDQQVALLHPLPDYSYQVFTNDGLIRLYMQEKMPQQFQSLMQRENQSGLSLTWFTGRYSNAIILFDAKADYVGYISVPQGLKPPALKLEAQPKKRMDKSMEKMSLVNVPSDTKSTPVSAI